MYQSFEEQSNVTSNNNTLCLTDPALNAERSFYQYKDLVIPLSYLLLNKYKCFESVLDMT